MKKVRMTMLTVAILILGAGFTYAQSPKGGVKGGLNLSNLYIDDIEDENVRTGFHVGVYRQLMLGPSFAIQPELNYSTKGAEAEYNIIGFEGERKFNLNYIDLPVLFTFKLGDDADIHIGPYVGYLVGVSTSTNGDLGDNYRELDRDDYEKWDYGLSGGLALNFDPIAFGVRYNYGLNEIAKAENAKRQIGDAKNSFAQVYIALNLMSRTGY
ncbi:porin family protein [Fulvivirga imtechensis]|nr:porin family protein [Fulvivirga imtechensis]